MFKASKNFERIKHVNFIRLFVIFMLIQCPSFCLRASINPLKSIIGDQNHDIYGFIVDELKKSKRYDALIIKDIVDIEQQAFKSEGDSALKPYAANVMEQQFSHILHRLCQGIEAWRALCIYNQDGVAIGICYNEDDPDFNVFKYFYNDQLIYTSPLYFIKKLGTSLIDMKSSKIYDQTRVVIYLNHDDVPIFLYKWNDRLSSHRIIGFVRYDHCRLDIDTTSTNCE